MKYYIIAGEASGDLHGSNLINNLLKMQPDAEITAWGGDKMAAAGAEVVKHYRDLAFMGFVEVVKHLGTIMKNIAWCKEDIAAFSPDVLVLIDYPGFNMRIASWARREGFKIAWYIAPQVWAWKANRIKALKRDVDRMIVILPFEVAFFKDHGMEVSYVGHPLMEVVAAAQQLPARPLACLPIIALLPGSREQEVRQKLPVMLQAAQRFEGYQPLIAGAPSLPDELYKSIVGDLDVPVIKGDTYNLLRQATAALVTSGTATLETALFGVPQVVCYRGNAASFWLAKRLVKIKYISLVNLIMDRLVVKELIQDDLTLENLTAELDQLLHNTAYIEEIKQNYRSLSTLLGHKGASSAAAAIIAGLSVDQPHNHDNQGD